MRVVLGWGSSSLLFLLAEGSFLVGEGVAFPFIRLQLDSPIS